jgi:hypothetical protein
LLASVIALLLFGFRAGACVDRGDGSPLESECFSGPDPVALAFGMAAAAFALYALYRFFARRS